MSFTKYITVDGDRWDLIAHRAYGDAMLIRPIVEANPTIPKTTVLKAGIILYIPVKSKEVVNTNLLPPWKR